MRRCGRDRKRGGCGCGCSGGGHVGLGRSGVALLPEMRKSEGLRTSEKKHKPNSLFFFFRWKRKTLTRALSSFAGDKFRYKLWDSNIPPNTVNIGLKTKPS